MLQDIRVVPGGGKRYGLGRHETVATGFLAALDTQNTRIDELIAQHHHQPVCGSHEFGVAVTPAHPARNGQCSQCTFDHSGQ